MSTDPYTLEQFPEKLVVARLAPGAEVPDWAESSSVFSVTATATETSIVCAGRSVPKKVPAGRTVHGVRGRGHARPDRRPGMLAGLAGAAGRGRDAACSTISTYDTDWVLVPVAKADAAAEAWRRQGHTVAPAVPV